MAAYDRLTQLDNSFLIYEDAGAPMHVAATQIHEAGPLRGADGHVDLERLLAYVASRLERIPRYRQRIARTPLEGHPVWVDDARFNLRYHVRHSRLPRPGSDRQLKRTVGRILSQQLDRDKPLWELWVIEGLEGDRVALVSKTHHCMIDGISGSDLLSELMTPEPTHEIPPAAPWTPRPAPGAVELAGGELWRLARAPLGVGSALSRMLRDEDHARHEVAERVRALGRVLYRGLGGATPTPLNQPVGAHRRVDWLPMDLGAIREVKRKLGGTVNDVVLATAAGAIGRFLHARRGVDTTGLDYRVMAPVSLRSTDEHGTLGNRVSAWIVPLPVAERDPLRRLEAVRAVTEELKDRQEALGAETLTRMTEWTGPLLLALGARLAALGTPFNMVVTNVPGPRAPLYLLGSRMLEAHPAVPLMGTLSAGIALFSYCDTLSWGFTADWDGVPDLHELVLATDRAFDELRRAAG